MTLIRSRPHGKGILGRNKPGPVLYLGDTQKSASRWSDISGRGNHGLVYGAGTPPPATPQALGYLFDGVDDYVDCGNNASLDITNEVTIAGWVKPNITSVWWGAFGKGASDTNGYRIILQGSTGKPYFDFKTTIGSKQLISTTVLNFGSWNHIVAIYDPDGGANNVKIVLNGITTQDTHSGTILTTADPFKIGVQAAKYFNGSIDEVRIYNRALSTSEIKRYFERTRILFGV